MSAPFAHLHVHSEYSLLDGAAKIGPLVARAKELGMDSLAITDHGVMYGVVDFYKECKKQGIKPIIGCEVYVAPGSRFERNSREMFHLILLAENDKGYHNLMKLVSCGHLEGSYCNRPRVDKEVLRRYSEGIICLSACISGEVPLLIQSGNMERARRSVEQHLNIFGRENYFLELQNHGLQEEAVTNAGLRRLAKEFDLQLVATNDSHYVMREDAEAQDVLMCIQTADTIDNPQRLHLPGDSFYLKSYEEMQRAFPGEQEALLNTARIAERCHVDLEFGHLLLPKFPVPAGRDAAAYLRQLCLERLPRCYPDAPQEVFARLDYELGIIHQMGYDDYFLIVWDFIEHCRTEKIPVGPGRGSAAGSLAAYLLGITGIDPLRYKLLFERFLNPERVSMPDIDTDFCYNRRQEVIDYVVKRYGKRNVAQIVTYGTLLARAAVRDVGRVLGLSYRTCDEIAKKIPRELGITLERALESSRELRELCDSTPENRRLIELARKVEGLPRNSGTHAAGVIIAPGDLTDYVPLQLDADKKGIVTQYDKDRVEDLGLLKMDFLGLRTLTVISDAVRHIKETAGVEIDIDRIPLNDAATCQMLCRGDTFGVFQLESAGITKLLTDLAPESFEDLIPLVALYRPGPLGTGMAEDFIAGRHGHRTAKVLHPLMEPILKDTYGVILYQEQVMQIASALGGFTLGQADILRRAMGKKKAKELDSMRSAFVAGAQKLHGISPALSEEIFALLQHFAGYGFNKSHSVAYALVAYQTAYLKAHWPCQYMAAFLDSVMGDYDKLSWYIGVCRNAGLAVLPPDVNESDSGFTVHKSGKGNAIRFGLAGIKGMGMGVVEEICRARQEGGPFQGLVDFCCRVANIRLNKRQVENLIRCGAMDSFGCKRSALCAVAEQAVDIGAAHQKELDSGQINMFADEKEEESYGDVTLPDIPEFSRAQMLRDEKELLSFYISGHPLEDYKAQVKRLLPLGRLRGDDCPVQDGQQVRVAGIISECKIKTTKAGDLMATMTLEDMSGRFPVMVFPACFDRWGEEVREENIVLVEGRLSSNEDEQKIIAMKIEQLAADPQADAEEQAAVHLKIAASLDNALTTRRLRELFAAYKGNAVVYLHMKASGKVFKTEPNFWVDPKQPGFRAAVEKILGPGSLHIGATQKSYKEKI